MLLLMRPRGSRGSVDLELPFLLGYQGPWIEHGTSRCSSLRLPDAAVQLKKRAAERLKNQGLEAVSVPVPAGRPHFRRAGNRVWMAARRGVGCGRRDLCVAVGPSILIARGSYAVSCHRDIRSSCSAMTGFGAGEFAWRSAILARGTASPDGGCANRINGLANIPHTTSY